MIAVLFWVCVGGIIYVYFGYPLLLAILARFRPAPMLREEAKPLVTLLIAAYNEAAIIERKLLNCQQLDYPPEQLQIVVAADGSDDDTMHIVDTFPDPRVELSYIPQRGGKMAAIDRAFAQVRGEIVVFSDANNMYDSAVIKELVMPFTDARVGAVTGVKSIITDEQGLSESEGLYWKYESFIKQQETRLGCSIGAPGEIYAIRRKLYVPPPANIITDDFYVVSAVIRQGYNVFYNPNARSYEAVSATAQDEITRRARIVAGRYQAMFQAHKMLPFRRPLVVWQIISHKFLRPLVPFAMIGALVFNIAALLWPAASPRWALWQLALPFNALLLALQLVFYGLAWLGNYANPGGRVGKLLYLPTFLVNSNLAALKGLYRYLTDEQVHIFERVQRRDAE